MNKYYVLLENHVVEGPYNLKKAEFERKYLDNLGLRVSILKEVVDEKGDLK